jgi:hypothetical protein
LAQINDANARQAMRETSPRLAKLPEELIDLILDGVEHADIIAIRSNRQQRRCKILNRFANVFFKDRRHLYTGAGLSALVEISSLPYLACKVEHIALMPAESSIHDCGA